MLRSRSFSKILALSFCLMVSAGLSSMTAFASSYLEAPRGEFFLPEAASGLKKLSTNSTKEKKINHLISIQKLALNELSNESNELSNFKTEPAISNTGFSSTLVGSSVMTLFKARGVSLHF